MLIGNLEELLRKRGHILLHLSTRGLSKHAFQVSIQWQICRQKKTSGQVFDNVQRAIIFIQKIKGLDRMPGILKKNSWKKGAKMIHSALFKRQRQRKLVD